MHSAFTIVAYTLVCLGLTKCFEMRQQLDVSLLAQSTQPRGKNMVARIDGDLILGGLFSLHRFEDEECQAYTSPRNIMRVEAMLYAIEEINNNSQILPNITLGAEIRDDCYSGTIALEESLHFVLNAFSEGGNICTDPDSRPSPVMGVVGTASSQPAITVASFLRLFRLPQISYGATSPDLSNKDDYEYFTRTVPSDECQAEALVDIIMKLEWSAVFVISSTGNYGERIREAFVRFVERQNRSICIVDELRLGALNRVDTKIEDFLLKINERKSVRGVVLLTETFHTYAVLRGVNSTGISHNRFKWLGTDTWGTGQPLAGVERIANETISIALHTLSPDPLKDFQNYFYALKPGTNPTNPWFDMFWERVFNCVLSNVSTDGRARCNGNESYGHKLLDDDKTPYVFDAVYAFAHSLHAMLATTNSSLGLEDRLKQLSDNEVNLLDYLMNTSFIGKSGPVSFDHNGDGLPRYDVMNYMNGEYRFIAVWVEGLFNGSIPWFETRNKMADSGSSCGQKCKIGEGHINPLGDPLCCWQCQPCSSPATQYVDSDFHCQACAIDERPYQNRTGCERLPEDGPVLFVIVLLTIWGCLGLIATFFVAFTIYRFYSTPLIMASGRELMLVLLLGIALSFCLGFALLGRPSVRRCVYQRFGSGVSLAICYSAILVKTNRVARIFRGQHRPAFITRGPQLVLTALLVSIQVGISLIASMFGTAPEVTAFYEPEHFHMICRTSGMEYIISISYNVLLLLLCTVYAFLTRKLPANFNEAKLVGITMYTTCVQWICFIPLFYGTKAVYQTSVLLLSSCFNATVLLIGMFGHKIYVVWFRSDKNTRKASNPRGRVGSTTSASAHSVHTDDVGNGNYSEKDLCGDMKRHSSKATLVTTVGIVEP